MTDTTFQSQITVVTAPWCQDINDAVYRVLGQDGTTPVNPGLAATLQVNTVRTSIAALRAAVRTSITPFVFVTGYRVSGDGGGGLYWANLADMTSLDNNGTIIVGADGTRWYLNASYPVSIFTFGAYGDGTHDDAPALASYVAALPAAGGLLYLPGGRTYAISAWPDFTNKTGITVKGDGGVTAGAAATTLVYVNATGAANFINAPGSVALCIEGIQFITKNASFTGFIVGLGSSPANSAFTKIRRCGFYGSGAAKYIAKAITLDKAIEVEIDSCVFGQLLYAINGANNSSFSNVVKITQCQFIDTSQIPIQGGGQAWWVKGNTFEGYNSGTPGNVEAGAMVNFPTNPFNGLEFASNWLGDVLTNGGTWLSLSGGGIEIHGGNFFGGNAASDAIALASVDSANITGNTFNTFQVAITFGTGNGPNIRIGPNEFISVTNRFGSTANWPGYAGPVFYEPLSNAKMRIYGQVTVTAGTPVTVAFPFSLAATPESINVSLIAPTSSTSTVYVTSPASSQIVLNTGGPAGTSIVYWEVSGPLPN